MRISKPLKPRKIAIAARTTRDESAPVKITPRKILSDTRGFVVISLGGGAVNFFSSIKVTTGYCYPAGGMRWRLGKRRVNEA